MHAYNTHTQRGCDTVQPQREMGKRNVKKNFTEIFGQNIRESVGICPLNTESKKRIPNKMHHIEYKNGHRDNCKPKSVKIK